jgi:hypothetical protein
VERSSEHGNEPSGSIKCWEVQEGLISVKLVILLNANGFLINEIYVYTSIYY